MVAIRKTCGAEGQNNTQLQPTKRHNSWSGENNTSGLGRKSKSELSGVYVNDGVWDDGVCIDYRICVMGHNSLLGLHRECYAPELWTVQPLQIHMQGLCGILNTSSCSCKTENAAQRTWFSSMLCWGFFSLWENQPSSPLSLVIATVLQNNCKCMISFIWY